MREYYARFFREVRKSVFMFWKAQIAVSMSAGVIAPLAGWVAGLATRDLALLSAGTAVAAYLIILGVFSICAAMCAPVRLDQERVSTIRKRDVDLGERQSTISSLEEALARKHAYGERKEMLVRAAWDTLSDQERRCVEWLIGSPRAGSQQLHQGGFNNEIPRAIDSKTGPIIRLLAHESYRPGNGTIEMDRFYSISPEVAVALKNVLHPPPRPVTPLPE